MTASRGTLLYLLLSCLTISTLPLALYCGSNCIDYLGACYSAGYSNSGCIVCAPSIYNQNPDPTSRACILNNQTQLVSVDLQAPISLQKFSGPNLTPFVCGTWYLSGKYTAGDFLTKTYQTSTSHYMIVLRYNIIFMGNSWSTADTITVAIDNNITTVSYRCSSPSALCTSNDCPKIGEARANHNSSNATVKFSSNLVAPSTSTWGISNLIITLLTCHTSCGTCFGPSQNQCLSCTGNNYLNGNTCVRKCPSMAVPASNLCASACPSGFYPVGTTKTCSPCSSGCTVCTGPLQSNCVLEVVEASIWKQQYHFWVFLMVIGGIIILVGLVFLVMKRRKSRSVSLREPIYDQQKGKHASETTMKNVGDFQKAEEIVEDEMNPSQSSSSNSNSSDQGPKAVKVRRKWRGKQ